jgi:hypothetical protein
MSSLTCLVISPLGDPGSTARKRADQVFKHIIEPVVSALGYSAKRADEMGLPGIITGQLLAAVADSDLVVADLTDHDANVFYELAVRHAAQRPVVQLIDSSQRPPFDLADMRTIHLDIRDLDSAEEARRQLEDQIERANASSPVDTPIASAKAMKTLWESQEPAAPILAEALNEIRALEQERIRRSSSADGAAAEAARPPGLQGNSAQLSFPGQQLFPGRPLFTGLPSAFTPAGGPSDAAKLGPEDNGKRGEDSHDDNGHDRKSPASSNHDGKRASNAKGRKAGKRHG